MKYNMWLLFFGLMTLSACSIFQHDHKTKRTFPPALNFRSVSLQQLQDKVNSPDSVNVEGYVVEIAECPPDDYCFAPDGLLISDTLHPVSQESKYRLTVYKPSQFKKDRFYQLSLKIGTYPGNGDKSIDVAGYSSRENEIH